MLLVIKRFISHFFRISCILRTKETATVITITIITINKDESSKAKKTNYQSWQYKRLVNGLIYEMSRILDCVIRQELGSFGIESMILKHIAVISFFILCC